jgi:hypothetical protein
VFLRVIDPVKAVVEIRDYQHGVLRIAQTTLRATLGQHDLDDLRESGGDQRAALFPIPIDVLDAVREHVSGNGAVEGYRAATDRS